MTATRVISPKPVAIVETYSPVANPDVITYDHANGLQKTMRRIGATGPGSWLFSRTLHHVDNPIAKITRGRHTLVSMTSGLPIVSLTTTGAKSGLPRTVPLVGLPVDGGMAVIASNFGQTRHPAWYYNLRADPAAATYIDGTHAKVVAVEVVGDRRAAIWQQALQVYPGFKTYERRATEREIIVFVLEPV
jgi:deazaflavin-dependent oxidoreductase (nitroreductase family)